MMKPTELPRRAAQVLLAAVLIGAVVAGCARDGANQSVLGPADGSSGLAADGGDQGLGVKPQLAKKTLVTVDGADGGVVLNGRYLVAFAPAAFEGDVTVSVENLNRADGAVELGPHGLAFGAPVTLTINLLGTVWDSPHPTIEWYDPSAGSWVDIGGHYSPTLHTVTTVLPHFSTYRPRAGW